MTTLKPFDHLAGSSFGTWTNAEVMDELNLLLSKLNDQYKIDENELTGVSPDSEDYNVIVDGVIDELIDLLQDYAPDYCTVQWEDNEVRVIPYIDDELPKVSDIPLTNVINDTIVNEILVVNDHGNVSYMTWDGEDFVSQWDMV